MLIYELCAQFSTVQPHSGGTANPVLVTPVTALLQPAFLAPEATPHLLDSGVPVAYDDPHCPEKHKNPAWIEERKNKVCSVKGKGQN